MIRNSRDREVEMFWRAGERAVFRSLDAKDPLVDSGRELKAEVRPSLDRWLLVRCQSQVEEFPLAGQTLGACVAGSCCKLLEIRRTVHIQRDARQ